MADKTGKRRPGIRHRYWALLILPLLVQQGVYALNVVRADFIHFAVQRDVVFWGNDDLQPAPARVDILQQRIELAMELVPGHADYLALHARILAWQAVLAPERRVSNANVLLAIASMQQSLKARPANPYSWAQYAEYLATQPLRRNELQEVVVRIATLAPGDSGLQQRSRSLLGS
jgi:hypothetical protein